ncbi:hypothetical protein PENSPDRAFT_298775 [Peniophora sp. CONT]|nr:hypothetical protein PENSPDRAFT_298775 [Peniophora sp. CONT]
MAKPTLRQLYMVWAKLRVRPDLECEVDRRHNAALEETGDSSRGAVWNAVAAEWYNACSEDEKTLTRQEALKLLDVEMKDWEERAAADPSSPEEAHAFMEGSEEFLRAMMQFFANRVSGIAVMFLAGPNEVSLSEAVCETPGRPKVLYSQIAEEETTLRLMGGRILSQSQLLNESKWGVQLADDDESTAQDDHGVQPVEVDSHIDPILLKSQQTTPVVEADASSTISAAAEIDGSQGHAQEVRRARHCTKTVLIVLIGAFYDRGKSS